MEHLRPLLPSSRTRGPWLAATYQGPQTAASPIASLFILLLVISWSSAATAGPGDITSLSLTGTFGDVLVDSAGAVLIADSGDCRVVKLQLGSGLVSPVAGNGNCGPYDGDGGPATAATIGSPYGLAVDSDDNIYIATNTHHVRRVDAQTGIITTVAGNGDAGFSGDGVVATATSLWHPRGIDIDPDGNLFIADTWNNRIRRVDRETGLIETVAGIGQQPWNFSGDGGPATQAELSRPEYVLLDHQGGFYVSDTINNRVRHVASNGIITTVAGSGSGSLDGDGGPATAASLSFPFGLALDAAGNLFVADSLNNRIRRISASTGTIVTVAGGGPLYPNGGFGGDGGPALEALLNYPQAIGVADNGDIFIADSYNARLRKVQSRTAVLGPPGTINTIAGIGYPYWDGDGGAGSGEGDGAVYSYVGLPVGVATSASGDLYFADEDRLGIFKVSASTNVLTWIAGDPYNGMEADGVPARSAKIYPQWDLAVDAAENVYFAENYTARVRRIDASTGRVERFAGTGVVGFSGDGGPASEAQLSNLWGIALDTNSRDLYISEGVRIRRVDGASGIIETIAGNGIAGSSGDGGPAIAAQTNAYFLAVGPDASLYLSEEGRIRRVDLRTRVIDTIAGTGTCGYSGDGGPAIAAEVCPFGLVVDPGGNLFLAENGRIRRIDADTREIGTVAGTGFWGFGGDGGPATAAVLSGQAFWMTLDRSGNLFVADRDNGRVRRIDAIAEPVRYGADSDLDGILDDGDGSGVSGDAPCNDGETTGCDDNCRLVFNAEQPDADGDGVGDYCDNCRQAANPLQEDVNVDGLGDACATDAPAPPDGFFVVVGNEVALLSWNPAREPIDGWNLYVAEAVPAAGTSGAPARTAAWGPLKKINDTVISTRSYVYDKAGQAAAKVKLETGKAYRFVATSVRETTESLGGEFLSIVPDRLEVRPANPVVVLHGINSTAAQFDRLVALMSPDGKSPWVFGGELAITGGDAWNPVASFVAPSVRAPKEPNPKNGDLFLVNFKNKYADYGDGLGIINQGREVGAFLRAIRDAGSSTAGFALLGRSMGGLAARSYVQGETFANDVKHLVTHGTPHEGSPLANVGQLLARLPAEFPPSTSCRWYTPMPAACLLPEVYSALMAAADWLNPIDVDGEGVRDLSIGSRFLEGPMDVEGKLGLNSRTFPHDVKYTSVVHLARYPRWAATTICGALGAGALKGLCEEAGSLLGDLVVGPDSQDMSDVVRRSNSTADVVAYTSKSYWTHVGGEEDVAHLACAVHRTCLKYYSGSPVDIEVTDPTGRSVGRTHSGIFGAVYVENDGDDGEHETDIVVVPFPIAGDYQVRVIPDADAAPDDTFSLTAVLPSGDEIVLADQVRIADTPSQPYSHSASAQYRIGHLRVRGKATDDSPLTLRGTLSPVAPTTGGVRVTIASGTDEISFSLGRLEDFLRKRRSFRGLVALPGGAEARVTLAQQKGQIWKFGMSVKHADLRALAAFSPVSGEVAARVDIGPQRFETKAPLVRKPNANFSLAAR